MVVAHIAELVDPPGNPTETVGIGPAVSAPLLQGELIRADAPHPVKAADVFSDFSAQGQRTAEGIAEPHIRQVGLIQGDNQGQMVKFGAEAAAFGPHPCRNEGGIVPEGFQQPVEQVIQLIAESAPFLAHHLVEQGRDIEMNGPAQMDVQVFEGHPEEMALVQLFEKREGGFLGEGEIEQIQISLYVQVDTIRFHRRPPRR